jgi:VWFA-related protein
MAIRGYVILFLGSMLLAAAVPQTASQGKKVDDAPAFGTSLNDPPRERKKNKPPLTQPRPQLSTIPPPQDGTEIRVDTDLVLSDILVLDKNGQPVRGLTSSDFAIREDDREQSIAVFTNDAREVPRSIILIIDYSLSQLPHIENSVEAAKILVDKLKPFDRMAIVTDDIQLLIDYTSDKEALKSRLDALREKAMKGEFGISKQYSSLLAALNERCARDGSRQIVIFQTDGDEFQTLWRKDRFRQTLFSFEDITAAALGAGVTVYTVYTGVILSGLSEGEKMRKTESALNRSRKLYSLARNKPEMQGEVDFSSNYVRATARQKELDAESLEKLAAVTGGMAQSLEDPSQAAEVYDKILSDIDRRYLIGYYPANQARDGREREVKISVKGQSGYRIIGRKSYFAPLQ